MPLAAGVVLVCRREPVSRRRPVLLHVVTVRAVVLEFNDVVVVRVGVDEPVEQDLRRVRVLEPVQGIQAIRASASFARAWSGSSAMSRLSASMASLGLNMPSFKTSAWRTSESALSAG